MIQMPISEIADRYSICLLKQERTNEDLSEEIYLYENEVGKYVGVDKYIHQLYDINGEIWDLEASLRQGKDNELGLEEIGRRAIKIRNWNRKRITVKNQMVKEFGEGFKDIKVNHVSGDK